MNTMKDLAKYFSSDDMTVSINEFMKFWESLTNEEKDYYRTAKLV
jgi:hypothetical protein